MAESKKLNTVSKSERVLYFDFLRGVAAVMVVAIHTFGQCYTRENLSFVSVVLRQLMNCAVPVFCASSAYFLISRDLSGENYRKFLLKHIPRVYVPLLFCSLPYFAMDIRNGGELSRSLLKLFCCGYSVYYFVALIIQFYILLPAFQKFSLLRNIPFALALSFVWVSVYIYAVDPVKELPLVVYGGPVFCFLVYFSAGSALRLKPFGMRKSFAALSALAVLFLALSVIESYFRMAKTGSLGGTGLKPSAVLFSLCAVLLLYGFSFEKDFPENAVTKFISLLGKLSFGIYLTHLFVLATLNKAVAVLFEGSVNIVGGVHLNGCF